MKVEQVRSMLKNHETAWEAIEYLAGVADDDDNTVFEAVEEIKNTIHDLENRVFELEEYVEEVNS